MDNTIPAAGAAAPFASHNERPVAQHDIFRIEFTGSGSEYFRIWISNLALTVVSLGIYSAWAKVRRLQYFHRNTQLDGAGFDYDADPQSILRGRMLALGLFVVYNMLGSINVTASLVGLVLFMGALPWLLLRSLKFRLRYTSYRGVRFRFTGALKGAFAVYLGWPLLTGLTLGLLGPLAHLRARQYQTDGAAFGLTAFHLGARAGSFYALYGLALAMGLALIAASGALAWLAGTQLLKGIEPGPEFVSRAIGLIAAWLLLAWIAMLFVVAWTQARLQNLVWNHTTLGGHRFASDLRAIGLCGQMLWVRLLTLLTLGLYAPFGVIRIMKYRLERVSLLAEGSLDQFTAAAGEQVAALGGEAAEFLDIDISL